MKTFIVTATLALFAVFTFVTVTDAQQYPHSFTAHTQSVGQLELKIDPVPVVTQTNTKQTLTYHLTNSSDKPIECQMNYSSTDTIRVEQSPVTITVPAKGTADGSLEFVVWTGAINGYYPIRVKATIIASNEREARSEKRETREANLASRLSSLASNENLASRFSSLASVESVRVIETRLPNPARFTPIIRPVPVQPVSTAEANQESQYQFTLNEGFIVTIYPGSMGLLDSKIVFTNPNDEKSSVTYNGVNISIKGKSLDLRSEKREARSETTQSGNSELNLPNDLYWTFTKQPKLTMDKVNNRLEFSTEVINNNRPEPILAYVYVTNGILIFDFPETNPELIDQIRFKSTDKVASRFFFGHGYVLNDPQRFSRGHGGHQLAASHVGFEFENGPAIVMSTPDCPERCELDKGRKIYTLECTGRARLELIPSAKGAYAAAVAFRQNDPFHIAPSPGAIRKRGMMLYDLWPGTYEENQKLIEKVAAYGVTNAMVCKHIWQHWGYDIHLPDIWNVNADNPIFAPLGTYEQLVKLSERCRELGFSFGLHDNYIDIYPDCTDFSYNRVAFHEDGTPQRAWYNPDFEAQSYRSRPDTLSTSHNKNMALDKKLLPCVDNVFIDVFTAIAPYNYYDINGNFHHKLETRQCWRNLYENTEKALSYTDKDGKVQPGIAFSESGGDHLIGSLAGGDCALEWNFVESPCALWNYSPWYAAVNHSNFARHGAGFPARFNNRGHWSLRNQLSDDYLCCEVLAGVDMMVSTEYIYPGSIRNYYLLEHLMMRLADKEIMSVEFVNDEIQLQTVTWSDGTKVTTNRCPSDRVVSGYTIPVCGYIALDKDGNLLSGIYRNVPKQEARSERREASDAKRSSGVDGSKEFTQSCGSTTTPHSSLLTPNLKSDSTNLASPIIEVSNRPDGSFYVSGRGYSIDGFLSIEPVLKSAEILNDGKQIRVQVDWKADRPAPKDLAMFIHVYEPFKHFWAHGTRHGWYAGKEIPTVPSSQWKSEDGTQYVYHGESQTYDIPDGLPDGDYRILAGMCDPKTGGQFPGDTPFINHTFTGEHDYIRDPRRLPLLGYDDQENRVYIGSFRIRGGRAIGSISPITVSPRYREEFARLAPNLTPMSYRGVETLGPVVVTKTDSGWELLPLPLLEKFTVTLDESVFGKIASVTCNGTEVQVTRTDSKVSFEVVAKDAMKYVIGTGTTNQQFIGLSDNLVREPQSKRITK